MAFLHDLLRPKTARDFDGDNPEDVEKVVMMPSEQEEGKRAEPITPVTDRSAFATFMQQKKPGPSRTGKLVLLLDDVLSRVPTHSLRPGLHDPTKELHF